MCVSTFRKNIRETHSSLCSFIFLQNQSLCLRDVIWEDSQTTVAEFMSVCVDSSDSGMVIDLHHFATVLKRMALNKCTNHRIRKNQLDATGIDVYSH